MKNFVANSIESIRGIFSKDNQEKKDDENKIGTNNDQEITIEPKELEDSEMIYIDPKFKDKVVQLLGMQLVEEDPRNDHFPINSNYIVFIGSSNYLIGRSIGYICIENRGEKELVLASRKRVCSSGIDKEPHMATIPPNQRYYFDFKGDWCIEIVEGQHNKVAVVDFSEFGGKGNNNKLLMV